MKVKALISVLCIGHLKGPYTETPGTLSMISCKGYVGEEAVFVSVCVCGKRRERRGRRRRERGRVEASVCLCGRRGHVSECL